MDKAFIEKLINNKIESLGEKGFFAYVCNKELIKKRIAKDIFYRFSVYFSATDILSFYIKEILKNTEKLKYPKEKESKILENLEKLELEEDETIKNKIKENLENETLIVRMLLPSCLEIRVKKGMEKKKQLEEIEKYISSLSDEQIIRSLSNFDITGKSTQEVISENGMFDNDIIEVCAIYSKEEFENGVVRPASGMSTKHWDVYAEGEYKSISQKLEDENV